KKVAGSAQLLIERTSHADPFVRAAALRALRELIAPEAMPAALRALNDASPEVRREAIGVLGYLKADAALPALMAVANDADASVRRAVMSALVFTRPGGPSAAALLAGLDDAHWQGREPAAAPIGQVENNQARRPPIPPPHDANLPERPPAA